MTRLSSELIHDTIPEVSDHHRNPSFIQYDAKKFGKDIHEENYPEIELIEIPVTKRMVFQFNKPVKLEFS